MSDTQFLDELLATLQMNRHLTIDFMNSLSDEELTIDLKRPGLNTLAKHFEEIIDVQFAFASAIRTGTMDFADVPEEFKGKSDATSLVERFAEADKLLEELARAADPDATVDWGDGAVISVYSHLVNLISHEVFHQGQFAMAMYHLGISVPESWVLNWAMPRN